MRQPTYPVELLRTVQKLREHYPGGAKDKLVVLLHQKGLAGAAAALGRIITRLKARGVLQEAK